MRKQCVGGVNKLKALLDKKKKVYKEEELQSKSNSVNKLGENVRILGELFEDQNKAIGRALRGVDKNALQPTDDIEA